MSQPKSRAEELAGRLECSTSWDRAGEVKAAAELRRLSAEVERMKEHAVTLANTTFLATLERCANVCESHFNHEAKDCAEEIRALKDQA